MVKPFGQWHAAMLGDGLNQSGAGARVHLLLLFYCDKVVWQLCEHLRCIIVVNCNESMIGLFQHNCIRWIIHNPNLFCFVLPIILHLLAS